MEISLFLSKIVAVLTLKASNEKLFVSQAEMLLNPKSDFHSDDLRR